MWCVEFLDMYSGFLLLYIFADVNTESLAKNSNLRAIFELLSQAKSTQWANNVNATKFISEQDYHPFNLFCQILEHYRVDKNLQWVPLRSKRRLLKCFHLATKFASIQIMDVKTQSFFAVFYGFFKIVTEIIKKNDSEEATILAELITPIVQSAVLRNKDDLTEKGVNYFVHVFPAGSCFRFADKAATKALSDEKKVQLITALKDGMRSMILERQMMVTFDITDLFMTDEEKFRRFAEEERRKAEIKAASFEAENARLVDKIQEVRQQLRESQMRVQQTPKPIDKIYQDIAPSFRPREAPKQPEIPNVRVGAKPISLSAVTPKLSDKARLELLNIQKDMKDFMTALEKK